MPYSCRKGFSTDYAMYFESITISATDRRYAVYNEKGQMMFYTTSILAARMFMAGKNTNMWSGG